MRKLIAVLFLTFLVSSFAATTATKYQFGKTRSIITVMSQIQSKMNNKAPLVDLVNLLDGYFNEIEVEQRNHDQLFEKQVAECDDEASYRHKEVEDGENALQQAKVTLDHCENQHLRASRDLENNKDEQSKTRNYLANLIQTRADQAEQFQRDTDAYKYNSQAVDEAIVILQEIWGGQSEFIQLTRHANKMLKHAVSMRKVHKIAPLMAAFAQLTANQLIADEAALQNVLNLLNQFRDNVENDFRAKETAEHEAINRFNEQKASTEDYLAKLEAAQKELEDEIRELNVCINNQTAISQSAQAKVRRNQELLDAATNMCLAFAAEYASAFEGRVEEVKLLLAIVEKIKFRFEQISENVAYRALQDSFDEYVNRSPYETVKPFVHQQLEFNPKGAEAAGYERDERLERLFL